MKQHVKNAMYYVWMITTSLLGLCIGGAFVYQLYPYSLDFYPLQFEIILFMMFIPSFGILIWSVIPHALLHLVRDMYMKILLVGGIYILGILYLKLIFPGSLFRVAITAVASLLIGFAHLTISELLYKPTSRVLSTIYEESKFEENSCDEI